MCTSRINERLVGQLECYMDDMVECFEEFVKKSMLVISVAVGTLVLMVMYVLKRMIERAASTRITFGTTAGTTCKCCQVCIQDLLANVDNVCTNTKSLINVYLPSAKFTKTVSSEVVPTISSSNDGNSPKGFKKNIDSKPCDTSKNIEVCEDLKNARNKITSTTKKPCISKNHLSTSRRSSQVIEKRNSCCSVCCGNERSNKS